MNEKIMSEISATNKVDVSKHKELDGLYAWFECCDLPSGFRVVDGVDENIINMSKHDMPDVLFNKCSFEEDCMLKLKVCSEDGKSMCGATIFDSCKFVGQSCNLVITVENYNRSENLVLNHLFNNTELPEEGTITVNLVRTDTVDAVSHSLQLFSNMYIGKNVHINLVGYKDTDCLDLSYMFSCCEFEKGFNFRDNVTLSNPKVSKSVSDMLDHCKLPFNFFIPASFFDESNSLKINFCSQHMPFNRSTYSYNGWYDDLCNIMGVYKRNHAGCEMGSVGISECEAGKIPTTYKSVMEFITTEDLEERCIVAVKSVMENKGYTLDKAFDFVKSCEVFGEPVLSNVYKSLADKLFKASVETATRKARSLISTSNISDNGKKVTVCEIRNQLLSIGFKRDVVNECLVNMMEKITMK